MVKDMVQEISVSRGKPTFSDAYSRHDLTMERWLTMNSIRAFLLRHQCNDLCTATIGSQAAIAAASIGPLTPTPPPAASAIAGTQSERVERESSSSRLVAKSSSVDTLTMGNSGAITPGLSSTTAAVPSSLASSGILSSSPNAIASMVPGGINLPISTSPQPQGLPSSTLSTHRRRQGSTTILDCAPATPTPGRGGALSSSGLISTAPPAMPMPIPVNKRSSV
jgi:hypothetical protein